MAFEFVVKASKPDIDKLINVLLDDGKKVIPNDKKPMNQEIARIIYESCE